MTDARVARRLTTLAEAVFLKPFHTPQGCAAGQAARQFGLSPNAAYRKVRSWAELGVLEVVHTEARRGKPIRHYRTVARAFFIPSSVIPTEVWIQIGLHEQMTLFHESLARAVHGGINPVGGLLSGEFGSHLRVAFATPGGQLWNPRAPGTAVTKWAFKTLRLDHARAQELVQELRAVAAKYYGDQGRDLYLLGQFITPVPHPSGRDEDSALRLDG